MNINKYKHLTETEIDRYLAMTIEDFRAEIATIKSNLIKRGIQFKDIDKNRPLTIGVAHEDTWIAGGIYIKRGNKLFEILPHGEQELRISQHKAFDSVMYIDDKWKVAELDTLAHFMLFKPQGGSKYCVHSFSIRSVQCPFCGALNQVQSIN